MRENKEKRETDGEEVTHAHETRWLLKVRRATNRGWEGHQAIGCWITNLIDAGQTSQMRINVGTLLKTVIGITHGIESK